MGNELQWQQLQLLSLTFTPAPLPTSFNIDTDSHLIFPPLLPTDTDHHLHGEEVHAGAVPGHPCYPGQWLGGAGQVRAWACGWALPLSYTSLWRVHVTCLTPGGCRS
jgi:hypothetical protein